MKLSVLKIRVHYVEKQVIGYFNLKNSEPLLLFREGSSYKISSWFQWTSIVIGLMDANFIVILMHIQLNVKQLLRKFQIISLQFLSGKL
jgi:hypothetical protein